MKRSNQFKERLMTYSVNQNKQQGIFDPKAAAWMVQILLGSAATLFGLGLVWKAYLSCCIPSFILLAVAILISEAQHPH